VQLANALALASSKKLTCPVGVLAVPGETSLTVAVHCVELFTGTLRSAQLTLVAVARLVAITAVVPLEPR
jgi:hypothetical protein